VNGLISRLQGRKDFFQSILNGDKAVNRVPDDEGHIHHQQAQHQKIQKKPDRLTAGSEFLAVYIQHGERGPAGNLLTRQRGLPAKVSAF
jgi:hypothetical protein